MNGKLMKTVTICGSMRFEAEMRETAWKLETQYGMNVLQCVYSLEDTVPDEKMLQNLEQAHYRKIDLSDAIYVVDIGGYMGESTKREIAYARERGREVILHSIFMR